MNLSQRHANELRQCLRMKPYKEPSYLWVFLTLIILSAEGAWNALHKLKLFPLPCSGKLCSWHLSYVHVTCLYCRGRRRWLGKYSLPKHWIEYTYRAFYRTYQTRRHIANRIKDNGVWRGGQEYTRRDGGLITVTEFTTLRIDPRGRFRALRCSAIIVLDTIMCKTMFNFKVTSHPLAEVCEFLSNYPK